MTNSEKQELGTLIQKLAYSVFTIEDLEKAYEKGVRFTIEDGYITEIIF